MHPSAGPEPRQHGVKGVYLAGEWVDIEDCAERFNIKVRSLLKYRYKSIRILFSKIYKFRRMDQTA